MTGAAGLIAGSVGMFVGAGASAYAQSNTSASYTIGYKVTGVSFASSSDASSATANYTVGFTMPTNVSTSTATVDVGGLPDSSLPTSVVVTNTTTSTQSVDGFNGTSVSITNPVAGDSYTLEFLSATNTGVTSKTSYDPTVTVNSLDYGMTSSAFELMPSSTSPSAVATATSTATGQSVNDSFSGFAVSGTTASSALFLNFGTVDQTYPTAPTDYTVSVNSNGTTTSDAVTLGGVTTGSTYLELNLANSIPTGATVSVSIDGTKNKSLVTATTVEMSLGSSTAASGTVTISNDTDVAEFLQSAATTDSAELAVNPTSASASSATWTISLTLPSGYSSSDTAFSLTSGTTDASTSAFSGWAVYDTTTTSADMSGTGTSVTLGSSAKAGDSVTIDLYGVVVPNGSTSAMAEFDLGSGASALPFATNSVTLSQVATESVNVVPSTPVPGAAATYTVSGLAASSGGITAQSGSSYIGLDFPTGTVLPTNSANYTVTDLTNSSLSGVYSVGGVTGTSADPKGIQIETTNTIPAGNDLQITITGVINPDTANTYNMMWTGNVMAAAQKVTAVPNAATTYPNGALILSGGQIDVVAGGYAFGIPNGTVFSEIKATDMSKVVSGSFPTAASPAPGTLIHPVGSAGIWVVGTNGEIYQFSSMSQFMQDGYSMTQVVPVPAGAAGLVAGVGTLPTAAQTMANGALVQFGKTVYEYAGGVPTGIATEAELSAIQKVTGATVVMGSGSTATSGTVVTGALVHPLGTSGIWVSVSNMALEQFSTGSQFTGDGYSFQYVLPVASVGAYTAS
jgi:hypothetical protein